MSRSDKTPLTQACHMAIGRLHSALGMLAAIEENRQDSAIPGSLDAAVEMMRSSASLLETASEELASAAELIRLEIEQTMPMARG